MPRIAWCPHKDPKKAFLVAIRCLPEQEMDLDIYMSLPGDRTQHLVDEAPDRDEAVG